MDTQVKDIFGVFRKKVEQLAAQRQDVLVPACIQAYTYEMKDLPYFAVRLRQLRAEAKMTQQELAQRASSHRQTIAHLEMGTRLPTWETVQLLARALGVDCRVFIDPALQPPDAEPSRPKRRPRKHTDQAETPAPKAKPKARKRKG